MAQQALFFDLMERGNLVLVRLDGAITEDNRLQERMALVQGRKILINLAKVERINSCGVRDWVRWLQQLESQGNSIHLVACSPAVVAQLNMVRNFCGARGHVVSFQAPYYCETCDRELRETYLSSSIGASNEAPPALCVSCGLPMQFDDLEASYFAFLREHGPRPVDPEVQSSMNKFEDVHLATKVAALKEISSGTRIGTPPGVAGHGALSTGNTGERPALGTLPTAQSASPFASTQHSLSRSEKPLATEPQSLPAGVKK